MSLSGVQNALSGFPARPPAGWPLKTCLHAEVRRFDTQACGNDIDGRDTIFENISILEAVTAILESLPKARIVGELKFALQARYLHKHDTVARDGGLELAAEFAKVLLPPQIAHHLFTFDPQIAPLNFYF